MTDTTPSDRSPERRQGSSMAELESLFEQIAEVPPDQQDALLCELCADNSVRDQVRALLIADSVDDQLLDHSLVPEPTPKCLPEPVGARVGERIDGYALIQELAQGGMGVVFKAEQVEPVRRKVALKVIKPGVDTREVIARFDAERQALSMMDHPNIAKVLDAGSTEKGHPYFVMELVNGDPITSYCDRHELSVTERLELFLPVCRAIQHAHQKGVIHRDIKPSNVLIAEYDGRPVAKVIDFGIAKAINQSLTDMTVNTGFGQIIGTFDYMSPEQSRVNQLDVDTRSDIYSLGVLLYELLTGSPPFDKQRLRSVDWDEMLRIIREEDPPKPSLRLATAKAPLASRSTQSAASDETIANDQPAQTQTAKIRRVVPGELDWIVMKAMDKDRNRRYGTPNGLANDLICFLNGDAVAACPPSPAYLFSKFAKRNKVALATSAIVAASLVLGLITTSWQTIRALRAEKAAETSAKESQTVNAFLVDDLLGLAGAESQMSAGLRPDPNLKLITLLDRASARVDQRFDDQPDLKATLQGNLANSFNSIGRYDAAAPLYMAQLKFLEEDHGSMHEDTIRVMRKLGRVFINQSRLDEAGRVCKKALENSLQVLGAEHSVTLSLRSDLASLYQKQKRYKAAEEQHELCLDIRSVRLGDGHPDTLSTMSNLGLLYEQLGRFDDAQQQHVRVLEVHRDKVPVDDLRIAAGLNNLGRYHLKRGRYFEDAEQFDAAETFLADGTKIYRRLRGADHPDTLGIRNNLAQVYLEQRRYDVAVPILADLADRLVRLRSRDDATAIDVVNALGWTYLQLERYAEAENVLADAHQALEQSDRFGPNHYRTIQVRGNLSIAYHRLVKLERSIPLDQKTLALPADVLGPSDVERLSAMARLGMSYLEENDSSRGRPLLEDAFHAQPNLPGAFKIAFDLISSYEKAGDSSNAIIWMDRLVQNVRENTPADSLQLSNALARSGARLLKLKAWTRAEEVMRDCLAIRKRRSPKSWLTFNAQSMLGEAVMGRRMYAEAEPLLLEAYQELDRLNQEPGTMPAKFEPRLIKSLERLIACYDQMQAKDDATKWRSILEQLISS